MIICKKCGKEFSSYIKVNGILKNLCNRKYCLECSPFGGHNTSKIHIEIEEKFCKFCDKKLNKISKKWNGKYCSNVCQKEYEWVVAKEQINKTKNLTSSPKKAKRYLKETQGIKCKICGITEWMGKEVPLVLDHINGNSSNCNIDNLRLICGNCDMQTDTYKGKNKGNGRYSRKMRYKEGKSY